MTESPICAHGSLGRQCRVCELEQENSDLREELKLMVHRVITCGVAASHPNANLTREKRCYSETWNSQQAEKVRELRADRDRLRAVVEQVEWQLPYYVCPWCRGQQLTGHAPDCARQAALGLKDGER